MGPIEFFWLHPDVAQSLPCWLSQFIGPVLFLYHEESLVSSNLYSKLFWFHCVRPNVQPKVDNPHFRGRKGPREFPADG